MSLSLRLAMKLEFSNYLYKFNYSLIAKNNVTKDC